MVIKRKRFVIVLASAGLVLLLLWLLFERLRGEPLILRYLERQATAMLKHKVRVQSISLKPRDGIRIQGLEVGNPEGFEDGLLLAVDLVDVHVLWTEIPRGRLHFRSVVVRSPVLNLMRDSLGRWNLPFGVPAGKSSEESRLARLEIDSLRVEAGEIRIHPYGPLDIENVQFNMQGLSLRPGSRTVLSGSCSYMGQQRIQLGGWASPGDSPVRVALSVESEGLDLAPWQKLFRLAGVDVEGASLRARIAIEGDLDNGFGLRSEMGVRHFKPVFLEAQCETHTLSKAP